MELLNEMEHHGFSVTKVKAQVHSKVLLQTGLMTEESYSADTNVIDPFAS